MKSIKIILAVLFLFNNLIIISQNEKREVNEKLYFIPKDSIVLQNYEAMLLNKVGEYDFGPKFKGIAIEKNTLDEKINKIFNTVVFSGTDIAANGSAIGFQQNKDNQTAFISGFTKLYRKKMYLKFGVTAQGASSPFNFYSANKWKGSIGGNIGVIYKPKNATVYYSNYDAEKNAIKRLKYIDSLIKIKITYSKQLENVNNSLKILNKFKPNFYQQKDSLILIKKKIANFYKEYKMVVFDNKKLLISKDSLFIPNPFTHKPISIDIIASDGAKKLVEEELTSFDKKNDITYGYKLNWFDLDLSLTNSTYNFEKENIDSTLYATQNNSLELDKARNKLNIGIQTGWHFTKKTKNKLYYQYLGFGINSGSFLNSNIITGTTKIGANQEIIDESNINNADIKGTFNTIDNSLSYMNISFYGAMFFGESQKIGINLSLKHYNKIHVPNGVFYKNNFTALFGPVFKATGADGKGVIVSLDLGYDNVLVDSAINNNFTARLRLGIPFAIYNKKKKEKKK